MAKRMAKNGKSQQMAADTQKQKKAVSELKHKEKWMQWALWAAVIIILLLLLLLGYATDWGRGLFKDTSIKPNLTSLGSPLDTAGGASQNKAATTNTSGGTDRSTATSGTDRSSTNTSTTNNSTTTTTNNTTTPPSNAAPGLLNLYANSSAGDNANDIIQTAKDLGLNVDCQDNIVIRVCVISDQNGNSVTIKNIEGTNTVTSILKNFQ